MFQISSLFLGAKNHAMSVATLIQLGKSILLLLHIPKVILLFSSITFSVRLYYTLFMGCCILTPGFWAETVFKEKHFVWDPMPELTVTSPYIDSGVQSPESTLSLSQGLRIWPQASSFSCLELASPHPRPLFSYNSHNSYLAFLSLGLSFSLWKRWSSLFILIPSFPWICQNINVQC